MSTKGPLSCFGQHLEDCERCRLVRESMAAVVALTHEIQVPAPTPDRIEAVRSSVLSTPRVAPRRLLPGRIVPALLALAAAGVLLLVFGRGRPPKEPAIACRGTVTAHGEASFRHGMPPDEVVRLTEGEIRVEVMPLHPGERFRVQVGDGEVEVHGTAFEVRAEHDRLRRVQVLHGVVEVRKVGRKPQRLEAGDRWSDEVLAAAVEPPAADPPAAAVPALASPTGKLKPVGNPNPASPACGRGSASCGNAPSRPKALPHELAFASPRAVPPHRVGGNEDHLHLTNAASPASGGGELSATAPSTEKPSLSAAATAAQKPLLNAAATSAQKVLLSAAAPSTEKALLSAAAPPLPSERAFAAGWQALNGKDYAGAAHSFERAAALAGTAPLAEDAGYWLAIAHARAGHGDAAIRALRTFLDRHPGSPRFFEVSSIMGWQILNRFGQSAHDEHGARESLDEAEHRFRDARKSPLKEIRESARAGLHAVASRRTP